MRSRIRKSLLIGQGSRRQTRRRRSRAAPNGCLARRTNKNLSLPWSETTMEGGSSSAARAAIAGTMGIRAGDSASAHGGRSHAVTSDERAVYDYEASSRYRGLDDEYPGLVASRNTVIVRSLGMVTWRERFRRPAYRTPSLRIGFPEEVVAMARGGQRRQRRPSDRRDRRAGTTRRQQLHAAARPRPLRRRRPLGGRLLRLCRSPGPALFVRLGMTPAEAIVTRHVSGGTRVRADREREH